MKCQCAQRPKKFYKVWLELLLKTTCVSSKIVNVRKTQNVPVEQHGGGNIMLRISDESYERVTEILEDIGYACETSDYYEDWEDVARSSFCIMDDLDADCYEMTCAAVVEKIADLYAEGDTNYAKGIHSAFQGYLTERRDYLEFNGYYDKPDELPEDADEDDIDLYNEKMERYEAYEGIINAVDKWIEKVGRIAA